VSSSVIAFYATIAGVVPVLFLAFAFSLGLRRLWHLEEPIYQAFFPLYVGIHGLVALTSEIAALNALITETDNDATRVIAWAGVVMPMLMIVIGLTMEAREIQATFDWDDAFEQSRQRAELLRAARNRRRARRKAHLEVLRTAPDKTLGSSLPAIERVFAVLFASSSVVLTTVQWVREGWGGSTAGLLAGSVSLVAIILFFELLFPLWLIRSGRNATRSASSADDGPAHGEQSEQASPPRGVD
jgi:hypothetical protein